MQIGLLDPESRNVAVPFDTLIARELQILGSHGMQASRYAAMMDLILQGRLNPGKLITRTISLSDSIVELIQLNHKPDAGITVINDFSK